MGFESIAHEAEGWMGYWLRGHEGDRYLGTFESNYKMAASEIKVSALISTILREKRDCEQSINVIIDCNKLFHHFN